VTGVLLVSLALVTCTACLLTAAGRPRSTISFVLGAYLVAWAELIAVVFGLSLFSAVGVAGLLAAITVVLVTALVVWYLRGAPSPPPLRPGLLSAATVLRDPPLAILAGLAALVVLYAVTLGTLTPQNEWDALTYHLARAALWAQQGHVGYIPGAIDARLNGNPPNAEIGQLAVLILGGGERLVWLPQLTAVLAAALAIFGIGRSTGWTVGEALFGALAFVTLPLVVLQMSSALNDLVVAAFFTVAAYFALGTGRRTAAAAALGLALGFGAKISAPLLLAVFILVVVAARRRSVFEIGAIVGAGVAGGSAWYLVNLSNTGSLDGHLAAETNQLPERGPVVVAWRAFRLTLDVFELPGASGSDIYLYAACAVGFLAAASIAFRYQGSTSRALVAASALTVAIPAFVLVAAVGLTTGWHSSWGLVGRSDIADTVPVFERPVLSDSAVTWFGPVGASLVLVGFMLAVRGRGPDRLVRVALAASPFVFLGIVAVGLAYDPWRGRFFVFPLALAAATWGAVFKVRALAWAVSGLAVTTVSLAVAHNHGKPPGLRLLDDHAEESVFGQPRWRVETWLRTSDGTRETIHYVETHVPPQTTIGLALRVDDYLFPYFGASLGRTVRLLGPEANATRHLEWIVAGPGREVPLCKSSWQAALTTRAGFRVLRRISADRCRSESHTQPGVQ
jgi:hypothetical protein